MTDIKTNKKGGTCNGEKLFAHEKTKRKIRDFAIYISRDFYRILKFDAILSALYCINIFTFRSNYFTLRKYFNVLRIFVLLITFYEFIIHRFCKIRICHRE